MPSSPFLTGELGAGAGLFASNGIVVLPIGRLLYVTNNLSNDVSAFHIDRVTGNLTRVHGSPFPTGGSSFVADAQFLSISLAATPDERFLFVANPGSADISVFAINNGSLPPVPGSPFPAGGVLNGMKVTPNGKFLAGALFDASNGQSLGVAMFSISSGGVLTQIPGSPFPGSPSIVNGGPAGIDVDCESKHLFAGVANPNNTIVDVYRIAPSGALSMIPGSPFTAASGINSNVVQLSADDRFLFVSNQGSSSVNAFEVRHNGALTIVPGSPFQVGGSAIETAGLAVSQGRDFLYTANDEGSVGVFKVGRRGALTAVAGSPFPTGQSGIFGLLSLAAFPPKTCGCKLHSEHQVLTHRCRNEDGHSPNPRHSWP